VILVGVRLVFEHQSQVYPKYYIRTMSTLSFSLDAAHQAELDAGNASGALREAFDEQDHSLSENARISVEEPGARWRLNDGNLTFTILRTPETLKVYRADVPIGKLNSINPFIICFGVILSTPIVARFKLFNVMFFGITVSAMSMFFLVIPPTWLCELFGWTLRQGYAVIIIVQIVVFSIGEVIWSPRLYEYTAAIAPKGREASYMGLSYAPMFFARSAEGLLAGSLLTKYCPPDVMDRLATLPYGQSPQFMCLILALIAIASPVLILVFRGVIQKGSKLERDERLGGAGTGAAG
jgi:dipeptide/tripeptide permease